MITILIRVTLCLFQNVLINHEEFDGLEFGSVGLGLVLEEMGKNLTKAPLFSSIVLGATTLTYSSC